MLCKIPGDVKSSNPELSSAEFILRPSKGSSIGIMEWWKDGIMGFGEGKP
jgi:hypothetical protein